MYQSLLSKVKELGDHIHQFAGKAPDIGTSKQRLTEHDIYTERALCEFIRTIDPKATFFAEEEHNVVIKSTESLWIIDPISNTFNFIHGLPHYSVCISHMVDGIVQFAVIFDPSMNELFYAEKEKGAYCNGNKITVSKNTDDLSILIGPTLVPTNLERNTKTINLITNVQALGTIRILGSFGLQYAYVACGRAECIIGYPKDIFPEMAGKLLVEEAGGIFTDFQGNEITLGTREVIASNGLVHNSILENIR